MSTFPLTFIHEDLRQGVQLTPTYVLLHGRYSNDKSELFSIKASILSFHSLQDKSALLCNSSSWWCALHGRSYASSHTLFNGHTRKYPVSSNHLNNYIPFFFWMCKKGGVLKAWTHICRAKLSKTKASRSEHCFAFNFIYNWKLDSSGSFILIFFTLFCDVLMWSNFHKCLFKYWNKHELRVKLWDYPEWNPL